MSKVHVIYPYLLGGIWVFDDAEHGLVKEPFVKGAEEAIEMMAAMIPGAESGFKLMFSATAFPGCQMAVKWVRSEHGGHWYAAPGLEMEGWFSPSMMKYFEYVPALMFVQADGKD